MASTVDIWVWLDDPERMHDRHDEKSAVLDDAVGDVSGTVTR